METEKYKFVLLKNVKFNKLWGWYLLVDTETVLLDVLERKGEEIAFAFYNMFEIKDGLYEFEGQKTVEQGARHSTKMEWIANFIVGRACEKKGKRLSLIEAVNALSDTMSSPRVKMFAEDGAFYQNENGGFMSLSPNYTVVKTSIRTKFAFPEEEFDSRMKKSNVKISKWPGGDHFYAKVGGQDVEWRGQYKWNSAYDAEQAAEKFAKKYKL